MGKYKVRTKVCPECGEKFTRRMRAQTVYCSRACFHAANGRSKRNGETATCRWCGDGFYVPGGRLDEARFCSMDCLNEWQGRNKTEHVCKICGDTFRWSPSRSKSDDHNITYCSLACRDRDPERLLMLRTMNAKQQELKPNKLERAGYVLLDSLGLDYKPQHLFRGKFCVDAFAPDHKLVIQFDGDYWHGKPDKYPEPDRRQRRRMQFDKSQDAYMEACGYRVIRFWESDIRKRPDHVKQVLLSAIRS